MVCDLHYTKFLCKTPIDSAAAFRYPKLISKAVRRLLPAHALQ